MSDVIVGTTHLERTVSSSRDSVIVVGTVIEVNDLSETIKGISISVPDERFKFKAGQWVDFTIPGIDTVGGFSMCSSPGKLQKHRILDLAVKRSDHPPANWVHTKCRVASEVSLKVGGDFFYEPSKEISNLLLVAGGVGINPLHSIMQEACECFGTRRHDNDTKICLLYSASSEDELIFKDELRMMAHTYSNVKCHFFVTKRSSNLVLDNPYEIQAGRISSAALTDAIKGFDVDATLAYLCGPKPMVCFVTKTLQHLGLREENIRKEEWW